MKRTKNAASHLNDYGHALRRMELAGAAIEMLEMVATRESAAAVRTLKRGQQRLLTSLDRAAAKLTAP
jgi:hypothetical protein